MEKKRVEIVFGEDVYQRLEKFCRPRVIDRTMFIKMAVEEKLSAFEEREAFIKSQKNGSKTTRAGAVPVTSATGMQIEIKTPAPTSPSAPTGKSSLPDRLEKSFRRYCEYVEGAEDARERSMRLQICFDEIKERAGEQIAEANASFLKLQEVLRQRQDTLPKEVATLPEGVPLDGDVDDST